MKVDEAILTALDYEKKVRDHYTQAAKDSEDAQGKNFFKVLAREEQGHVDYLEQKLKEWQEQGKCLPDNIATAIPNQEWIEKGVSRLKESGEKRDYQDDLKRLNTALLLEEEVSAFYKDLVGNVENPNADAMFRRFLEIEDGHTAIVQAEIDVLTRTGYFYDVREFSVEAE